MNEYMRRFLNIPDENIVLSIFKNTEIPETSKMQWEEYLRITKYRYGADVNEIVDTTLAQKNFKNKIKHFSMGELVAAIVTRLDTCLGVLNPYVNANFITNYTDFAAAKVPEEMQMRHRKMLFDGKVRHVLGTLELIRRQCLETEVRKFQYDRTVYTMMVKYDENPDNDELEIIKKKDEKEFHEHIERAGKRLYLVGDLRAKARENFASVLLNSQTFGIEEEDAQQNISFEYVMATKGPRIAGVLTPSNVLNQDGKIYYKKFCKFAYRYATELDNVHKEFGEDRNKYVRRTDRYLSEMIYGFNLIDFMLHFCAEYFDSQNMDLEWIADGAAEMMQIPDITARVFYMYMRNMLFRSKNRRERIVMSGEISDFIRFESRVYYPVLMLCVLECLRRLREKKNYDPTEDIQNALVFEEQNLFNAKRVMNGKKRPFMKSKYAGAALQRFYDTLKKEYYNPTMFFETFGVKCYDMPMEVEQLLQGMRDVTCRDMVVREDNTNESGNEPDLHTYLSDFFDEEE